MVQVLQWVSLFWYVWNSCIQWCLYAFELSCTVQFSSVQSFDPIGVLGDMRGDSSEILFQFFLQEAVVSSMGRVHAVMLAIQHFLC